MPDVLGEPVDQDRGWRSGDLDRSGAEGGPGGIDDVAIHLSDLELGDLDRVADALPARSENWIAHTTREATTDRLAGRFGEMGRELGQGRGFVIIRGLSARDEEAFRRKFWVIGNHLGMPVMQNARGEILSEVFDRFAGAPRGLDSRGYESNDELRFHCDGGDCIGLACVRQAPTGGESGLVSLLAIYNELVANHPEHLAALYRGFPLYVRKESEGDGRSTRAASVPDRRIPVFASENGRLSAWVNMVLAKQAAEVSGVPMDSAARAALDRLEEIAERPAMKLRFRMRAGDVLWVHNMSVMHRRDLYHDDPDPSKQRLFYRMWTNLHEQHDVIPEYAGLRRGIRGRAPIIVGP